MTVGISAVVVNLNSGEYLRACLSSLPGNLVGRSWEVAVIDNGSTDDSQTAAATYGAPVVLRSNTENLGFAKAVNQGIAATGFDLILLLNPDTRLLAGAVEAMVAELDRYPECGIVGPRVIEPNGAIQGSARGDPTALTGFFGRATLFTKLFPRSALAQKNIRSDSAIASGLTSVEVDWVSGACMLARRRALDQVGGFDERYFLFWEDADLCRRLRARGYSVRYVPGAGAVHATGRSRQTAPALAVRAFHRSAYIYYSTHIARSSFNPARWLAWALLRLRCWYKLL